MSSQNNDTYILKETEGHFISHMPRLFTTSRGSASYGLSFWDELYYLSCKFNHLFWKIAIIAAFVVIEQGNSKMY